jgi:hypothetical protein
VKLPTIIPLPHLRIGVAAVAAAAWIWACASGGGISGTSIVAGPITDFGSIIVNGIEFDTTDAVVTIEGDPADISDLRQGMYVFVRGPVRSGGKRGVAERVATDHLLEGAVDAVNAADGTFVSFSQLVITDATTVFDGTTIDTLAADDLVEVFGVRDADDAIRATRVEKKDDIEEFELTGRIDSIDETAMTFRIGLLTVDYSGAEIDDPNGTGLSSGIVVEAESDEAPISDLMIAVGVDVHDANFEFEDGDGIEIAGVVTRIISATEFILNDLERVLITPSTRFERGDADDLVLNAAVEVDGTLEADGTLVAGEIEFQNTD